MISNRDLIKKKYEETVLKFIKDNSELEKIINEKYVDYTSTLNFNPNTKKYTFNMTFFPKIEGPSVTLVFDFNSDLTIKSDEKFVENIMNVL